MNETKKNLPDKKIRAGPITATIWKASEGEGKSLLVVFDKSYRDKEGNWKQTDQPRPAKRTVACMSTSRNPPPNCPTTSTT